MAAIRKALGDLYHCVENLESIAKKQEQKTLQQQQDLFGSRSGMRRIGNVDSSLLAKKLDGTIAKIEQMLSEG